MNKSTSRALLYVRDVNFLPDEVKKDVAARVGTVVMNAGQRPAHVVRHMSDLFILPIDGPTPEVAETATDSTDETVDREHPLTFTIELPAQLAAPGITTVNDLYEALKRQGRRLYIAGRMQYFDGIDEYWMDWCKYMAEQGKWKTCPIHGRR